MISQIENLEDVTTFVRFMIEKGVYPHPDDDLNDYVNIESGLKTFTEQEAEKFNSMVHQSFDVCNQCNTDIYSHFMDIVRNESELGKILVH